MPECRIPADHDRLAVEVAHALHRLVVLGDDNLFVHVIHRHREGNLVQAKIVDRQVVDDDVALAGFERRYQLGKVIDDNELGFEAVGQRELLGDALLFRQRRAPPRQVGSAGKITRQQDAQLALAQDTGEIAVEHPGLLERAVAAVDIGLRRPDKTDHQQ